MSKAKKKATKKKPKPKPKAKAPPAPKLTEAPRWGAPKVVGNIGNRSVTIREPLNQPAIDSLSDDESLALVLAVLVGRLESNMAETGRLLGTLRNWAGTEALRASGGSAGTG